MNMLLLQARIRTRSIFLPACPPGTGQIYCISGPFVDKSQPSCCTHSQECQCSGAPPLSRPGSPRSCLPECHQRWLAVDGGALVEHHVGHRMSPCHDPALGHHLIHPGPSPLLLRAAVGVLQAAVLWRATASSASSTWATVRNPAGQ